MFLTTTKGEKMTTQSITDLYPSLTLDATYSAEDNKLRIYANERLEPELYAQFKEHGFRYAPKQELFVAPSWSPSREDFCIKVAGDIEAEESTMAERGEAKAARLDGIAINRQKESNSFRATADQISERFAYGQPILVGHHSERRARKDQERMHSAMDNAIKAHDAIQYWNWKAIGVERHANRKSNPAVRARRIKTLLADLRSRQRHLIDAENNYNVCLKVDAIKDSEKRKESISTLIGSSLIASMELYFKLDKGEVSHDEALARVLKGWEFSKSSPNTYRWISHLLNRIGFEQGELGEVIRFTGDLTPVLLQAFARTHGAEKPKVTNEGDLWTLKSPCLLPLHIAEANTITLTSEEWRDLMKNTGYEVPAPKPRRVSTAPKKKPLINPTIEDAKKLQTLWNDEESKRLFNKFGEVTGADITELKQQTYSNNSGGTYSHFETIELDEKGRKVETVWHKMERVKTGEPVCRIRVYTRAEKSLYMPESIVIITDKKQKALPISFDFSEKEEVAA